MKRRRLNPRLAKIHRNYSVEDAARLYGVHRNTVRNWIKQGLKTCDTKRPILILGRDLAAFLQARRARNKRPCGPSQLYCMRCRVPQAPAGAMVDYQPLTATSGNLVAICPACGALMYRRASLAKLAAFRHLLDLTLPQALSRISESLSPSVNSDFNQVGANRDDAQSK